MNEAHLHITLVHIPVVVIPLGFLILLVGTLRKNVAVSRVGLSVMVLATLIAVPAFLLGEDAEEIVEHLPGISEDTIEAHEEAADIAFWFTVATGLTSLVSLYALKVSAAWRTLVINAALTLSLVASCALAYAANQGGKIRHPEAFDKSQSGGGEAQEHDKD